MKIGIFYGGPQDVDSHIEGAVNAESDGLDSNWYPQITGPDALTVAALAGARTSRIEIGTSVTATYLRHPLALATQALTSQAATGGRFTLGIGVSHGMVVEGMWGVSYDRPAVHMREYLNIINALMEKGRADLDGEKFKVHTGLSIPGVTKPPVVVAALAPVMLKTAGAIADGTILWMTGPKTIESHVVPRLTKAAQEAGRPRPRVVTCLPVAVCEDPAEGREKAARAFQIYGMLPNYQRMLSKEGVSGPADVAIVGNEADVEKQIRAVASAGSTEFAAAEFPVGDDAKASLARTRALLKSLVGKV
jgi:F420-dependent oxidoreductase-like protein